MERDLALDFRDPANKDGSRFSMAEQDGFRYLMLRYRPDLPGTMKRPRRDWVFLFESSADRDPLLARTQAEVVRTILENAEHDDTFAVLTADTQVRRFADAPQPVTPENIAAALTFLERTHLLGALDLEAGLTAAAELLEKSEHPVLVHLGSGRAVLRERRPEVLAGRIPAKASYIGVAVGKQWSADFMQRAADRCQGHVTSINPDEPVVWRAFDLLATLNAPRLRNVRVTDPAGKAHFLCPSSMLPQGEELCAIARLPAGSPLPRAVRVSGTLDGKSFERELVVESPRSGASYLPRTWARLEIDRLLAEDAGKNKDAIVALSKAMYVMTPYTSLLVLENEAMYAQYKVDRGRKDHWAMYRCPEKIPVVYEPLEQSDAPITIQLEPLGAGLSSRSVQPDAKLKERIRQENGLDSSPAPITIQLEPPGLERLALSVQSDAQLQERIRQENRERHPPARMYDPQWMMNPYQGYLQGAADITNANAKYQLTISQAKIVRQQAIQESIRTRRAMIEEAEYERAHMPAPEKIRQRALERELDRARLSPPLIEIWSGRSLNALLGHLIAQSEREARVLNAPLDEDTLKSINLSAEDARGNIGLLKNNGDLQWPKSLQGEAFKTAREDLSRRLKQAVDAVRNQRKPDDSLLRAMQADLKKLRETLDDRISEMPPDEYVEARRYLKLLGNTVEALKDPKVVNYFNGSWAPRGKSVADLVRFMRENKLWFAPAAPGDEAAYVTLYQALAKFDAEFIPMPLCRVDFDDMYPARSPDREDVKRGYKALQTDPVQTKASLCRQDARAAEQRKDYDLARQRLEHALALEAKQPRDLAALRSDYAWLLCLVHKQVKQLTSRRQGVRRELLDRVMAVADRWRAVDPMDWIPCSLAARILSLAGERELAWGYLTTPAALHGVTADGWLETARQQHSQDDYDLAERAFAQASVLEPDNAAIVWERALNHRQAGHTKAARALFTQLAEGTWGNRYKLLPIRAREALKMDRE
jgi:hypothetical protein